mmetsp:Transcript_23758/g.35448  ORF Transcript_23758/g.35448 Transcript_23758/m.35448 type:complete len:373 (+) Transcript_23758:77-1195(+)
MTIFWDAYKNWDLIIDDAPGSHFQAWVIIAFHFTTTQSTEGTVKKGLLRLLATLFAGLSGFLCITACEGNPYASVAWLTFTTPIPVYLATERCFAARMGLSKDYGYLYQCFIFTQAIIVVYYRTQEGVSRNELVANRILANTIGIVMGMIFSLIPLNIWGGNPRIALNIVQIQKEALAKILHVLKERSSDSLETDHSYEEYISLIEEAESIKEASFCPLFEEANDLIADSNRFSKFPLLKVDPKLNEVLGFLGILNSAITTLADFAKNIISRNDAKEFFGSGMPLHNDLLTLLESLEKGEYDTSRDEENDGAKKHDLIGPPLFIEIIHLVVKELFQHEATLYNIKYGYGKLPQKNQTEANLLLDSDLGTPLL